MFLSWYRTILGQSYLWFLNLKTRSFSYLLFMIKLFYGFLIIKSVELSLAPNLIFNKNQDCNWLKSKFKRNLKDSKNKNGTLQEWRKPWKRYEILHMSRAMEQNENDRLWLLWRMVSHCLPQPEKKWCRKIEKYPMEVPKM